MVDILGETMTSWIHSEFNWSLVWVLFSQLDDTGPQLLILQRWKTHVRMFDFSLDLLYNRILLKYSWKSLFETTVTTSSKIENNLSFIVLIQVIQWDISGSFTCQSTCFIIILNIRCGHVVRDFESEAKTRCNFQFW